MKLQEEHEKVLISNASKISEVTAKLEEMEKNNKLLQTESQRNVDALNKRLENAETQCHTMQKYAFIVFISNLPHYLMFLSGFWRDIITFSFHNQERRCIGVWRFLGRN